MLRIVGIACRHLEPCSDGPTIWNSRTLQSDVTSTPLCSGDGAGSAARAESARRESNLAAREQLANQQSQRDRQEAFDARHLAIEERDKSRQLSAGLALDKGFALAQESQPALTPIEKDFEQSMSGE